MPKRSPSDEQQNHQNANTQEEQEAEQIFTIDNPHIQKAWSKYKIIKGQQYIPQKNAGKFLEYVFLHSKEELQLQLQDDTNYQEMLEGYLEASEQEGKAQFDLEEMVEMMNWALGGEEDQEGEEDENAINGEDKESETQEMLKSQEKQSKKQSNDKAVLSSEQLEEKSSPNNDLNIKNEQQNRCEQNESTQEQKNQENGKEELKISQTKSTNKRASLRSSIRKSHRNSKESRSYEIESEEQPTETKKNENLKTIDQNHLQTEKDQIAVEKTHRNSATSQFQTLKNTNQNGQEEEENPNFENGANDQPSIDKGAFENSSEENQQEEEWDWNTPASANSKVHHPLSSANRSNHHSEPLPPSMSKKSRLFTHDQNPDISIRNDIERELMELENTDEQYSPQEQQQQQLLREGPVEYVYQEQQYSPISGHRNLLQPLPSPQQLKQKHQKNTSSNSKPRPFKRPQPPKIKLISENSAEMKYIIKAKRVVKHKPKPKYRPEEGLRELYKFYCLLNSEYQKNNIHSSVASGSSKSTFDDIQSKNHLLYMHNFMLFCKDFGVLVPTTKKKQNVPKAAKNSDNSNNANKQSTSKSSSSANKKSTRGRKGSVPPSTNFEQQSSSQKPTAENDTEIQQKELQMTSHQQSGQDFTKNTISKPTTVWDRVELSNLFKREADYTLNVTYEKFIKLLQTVFSDCSEDGDQSSQTPETNTKASQIDSILEGEKRSSINQDSQSENPSTTDRSHDPNDVSKNHQNAMICKRLSIDREESYLSTMIRLKVTHRIITRSQAEIQTQKIDSKTHRQQQQQSQQQQVDTTPTKIPPQEKALQQSKSSVNNNQTNVPSQSSSPSIFDYERLQQRLHEHKRQKQQKEIQKRQHYLQKYATSHNDPIIKARHLESQLPERYHPSYTIEGLSSVAAVESYHKRGQSSYNVNQVIKNARTQLHTTDGHQNLNSIKEKSTHNKQNRPKPQRATHTATATVTAPINKPKGDKSPPLPNQTNGHTIGYKKLSELTNTPSSNVNNSLENSRMKKTMNHSRHQRQNNMDGHHEKIHSPLLIRMGCGEGDDLLEEYFDQQKQQLTQN